MHRYARLPSLHTHIKKDWITCQRSDKFINKQLTHTESDIAHVFIFQLAFTTALSHSFPLSTFYFCLYFPVDRSTTVSNRSNVRCQFATSTSLSTTFHTSFSETSFIKVAHYILLYIINHLVAGYPHKITKGIKILKEVKLRNKVK